MSSIKDFDISKKISGVINLSDIGDLQETYNELSQKSGLSSTESKAKSLYETIQSYYYGANNETDDLIYVYDTSGNSYYYYVIKETSKQDMKAYMVFPKETKQTASANAISIIINEDENNKSYLNIVNDNNNMHTYKYDNLNRIRRGEFMFPIKKDYQLPSLDKIKHDKNINQIWNEYQSQEGIRIKNNNFKSEYKHFIGKSVMTPYSYWKA